MRYFSTILLCCTLVALTANLIVMNKQDFSIELLQTVEKEAINSSKQLPKEFENFPNGYHLEHVHGAAQLYDSLSLLLEVDALSAIELFPSQLGTRADLIDFWHQSTWNNDVILTHYQFQEGLNMGRVYIAIHHSVKPREKELLPDKIEGEYPVLIRSEVTVYVDYLFGSTKKKTFILEAKKFMLDNCYFPKK